MRRLKALADPDGILNPGVILNDSPRAHVTDVKRLPSVEPEVDRCVECGFCERVCPSRDLTLTPRQRIAVRREMALRAATGEEDLDLRSLRDDYASHNRTCEIGMTRATGRPYRSVIHRLAESTRPDGKAGLA